MRSHLYASPFIPASLSTCTHTRTQYRKGQKLCTVEQNLRITVRSYLLFPEWDDREMS